VPCSSPMWLFGVTKAERVLATKANTTRPRDFARQQLARQAVYGASSAAMAWRPSAFSYTLLPKQARDCFFSQRRAELAPQPLIAAIAQGACSIDGLRFVMVRNIPAESKFSIPKRAIHDACTTSRWARACATHDRGALMFGKSGVGRKTPALPGAAFVRGSQHGVRQNLPRLWCSSCVCGSA